MKDTYSTMQQAQATHAQQLGGDGVRGGAVASLGVCGEGGGLALGWWRCRGAGACTVVRPRRGMAKPHCRRRKTHVSILSIKKFRDNTVVC